MEKKITVRAVNLEFILEGHKLPDLKEYDLTDATFNLGLDDCINWISSKHGKGAYLTVYRELFDTIREASDIGATIIDVNLILEILKDVQPEALFNLPIAKKTAYLQGFLATLGYAFTRYVREMVMQICVSVRSA